jgi:glycosyltransferase involved in cell wall biosynthesis
MIFRPAQKTLRIAYRADHRAAELRVLREAFAQTYPEFTNVPWTPIEDISRDARAALLAESAVYAALTEVDALALTSLEALASGCHVVGYLGLGGADFVGGEGGAWISEGDHISFCRKLAEACQDSMRDEAEANQGRATHPTASIAREEAAKNFRHAVGALYTGSMGNDPARFLR